MAPSASPARTAANASATLGCGCSVAFATGRGGLAAARAVVGLAAVRGHGRRDRLLLLGRERLLAASRDDGLRVRTGLRAAVDRGEDEAVACLVEQRRREGEPPAHVLERVVAHDGDPADGLGEVGPGLLDQAARAHKLGPQLGRLVVAAEDRQPARVVAVSCAPGRSAQPADPGVRADDQQEREEGERGAGESRQVDQLRVDAVEPVEVRHADRSRRWGR